MESGHCLVGISLGNTNTVIAYTFPDGRTEVIADKEGDRIIPFAISYMEDEIFHGIEAKKRIVSNPASTLQRFRDSRGDDFRSQALKHHILYIKNTAENFIGTAVDGCVIAVPHSFDSSARKALELVTQECGFGVCQIVSEPASSLLGYLSATPDREMRKQLALVIECGGTACSVSLIHSYNGKFAVLASEESEVLSGSRLDRILRDHLLGVFQKEKGVVLEGLKALAKLEQEAEQARITLSSSPKATISIDGIMGEIDFHTSVTRLRADMLFRQFYKDFASFLTSTLASKGLGTEDIEIIALSGGLTNTPKVLSLIENMFPTGTVLMPSANYDRSSFALEACARGAAAQASLISCIPSEDLVHYLSLPGKPLTLFSDSLLLQVGSEEYIVLAQAYYPAKVRNSVQLQLEQGDSHLSLFHGRKVTIATTPDELEDEDETSTAPKWDICGKLLEISLSGLAKGELVAASIEEKADKLEFRLEYKNTILCNNLKTAS